MEIVLLTALGVGGATVLGALLGFLFRKTSQKFNDAVLSFAAGVMLCASVVGLIVPSLEMNKNGNTIIKLIVTLSGIAVGAVSLN